MLWEVDIYPAKGQPDLIAGQAATDAADPGLAENLSISAARGYLIQGDLARAARLTASPLNCWPMESSNAR